MADIRKMVYAYGHNKLLRKINVTANGKMYISTRGNEKIQLHNIIPTFMTT